VCPRLRMLLLPRSSFNKTLKQHLISVVANGSWLPSYDHSQPKSMRCRNCSPLLAQQFTAEFWFPLFLECRKPFSVVCGRAQLALSDVFLLHRLPQTDALISNLGDQFARCEECAGGTLGGLRDLFPGKFEELVFWYGTGEQALLDGFCPRHQVSGVDQVQCAVGSETLGEQRVPARVQRGAKVGKR